MADEYRQVVIDTETTGLHVRDGHRIIEVAAVEIVNRRITGNHWVRRVNPGRAVEAGATAVHGIRTEDLAGESAFAEIVDEFLRTLDKTDLIGHNIGFDLEHLDNEFNLLRRADLTTDAMFSLEKWCRRDGKHRSDIDTIELMKRHFPGKQKSLNNLCGMLGIDRSNRTVHGALLDATLTAEAYLIMTSGQSSLLPAEWKAPEIVRVDRSLVGPLVVIRATEAEIDEHETTLVYIAGLGNIYMDPKITTY